MLHVENLSIHYREKQVLNNLSFELPAHKLIGIIGANGSGKTTLLKGVMGLLPLTAGKVQILGESLASVRDRLAYVPQRNAVDWDFPASVFDVVLMGRLKPRTFFSRYTAEDRRIAQACLEQVQLTEFSKRQISKLSGGQQQRVFLARALARQADLYFLDEPFAGVDMATEQTIIQILKEMRDAGKSIAVVHHDLNTVVDYFDYVLLLTPEGVLVGKTAEVFTPENLQKAFGGKLVGF
jgi:manganese/zinc/iron transport system ATP- binding protein